MVVLQIWLTVRKAVVRFPLSVMNVIICKLVSLTNKYDGYMMEL